MLYAVYAYDNYFEGLHGMYDLDIIEGTEKQAQEVGEEMSYGVIESYGDIYDMIMDEMESNEEDEDRFDEYAEADVNFNYWELDANKIPTSNIDELKELFNEDWEEFINKYAVKE
jgi:hypothetical protein